MRLIYGRLILGRCLDAVCINIGVWVYTQSGSNIRLRGENALVATIKQRNGGRRRRNESFITGQSTPDRDTKLAFLSTELEKYDTPT